MLTNYDAPAVAKVMGLAFGAKGRRAVPPTAALIERAVEQGLPRG